MSGMLRSNSFGVQDLEPSKTGKEAKTDCVVPDAVSYTAADGTRVLVNIPEGGSDKVNQAIWNNDVRYLSGLEKL